MSPIDRNGYSRDASEAAQLAGARPAAYSEELRDGTTIGPYLIERLVARAGFSNVYRGVDIRNGSPVAIKVLKQQLARSPKEVLRFQREFEALRGLTDPNIVRMYDGGHLPDRRPYIVMEWLDGATLREFLSTGPFSLEEALPVIDDLCRALTAAHEAGVIHRDLKPSNVILVRRPTGGLGVKLVDFGIAKPIDAREAARTALTTTGQALGTPYSMAPEQVTGQPLDGRTDVYALGILLFELLTGRRPFDAESALVIADMHLRVPAPSACDLGPVSRSVDAVIQRCLAKNPDHRYAKPADVVAALQVAARRRTTPPARNSGSARAVDALGLYFDLRLTCAETDVEDEVFDYIEDVLVAADGECTNNGMRIAAVAGTSFLAIAPLPADDGPRSMELRINAIAKVLAFSRRVAEQLPDHRLAMTVTAHRAPVVVAFSDGMTEFIGGDLLSVNEWLCPQRAGVSGVVATETVVAGCGGRFEVAPLPGAPKHRLVLATR